MTGAAGASPERRRIAVVTGSRAEFGLLAPVMEAVRAHPALELNIVVAGAHLLPPALTRRDVAARFEIAAEIPMQREGATGRLADARALGRGVEGCADAFERLRPAFVVVLGDRIEALAAASAASVGGVPVAHLHGGDRAEGVADEAMRHAITKLAHVHLAATEESGARIVRMGEHAANVHVVGSPAVDGLDAVEPMGDDDAHALGDPDIVFLMHPIGDSASLELERASLALEALRGRRILALHPNFDPGREGVLEAIEERVKAGEAAAAAHLARDRFVALLKRLARSRRGAIVGNSSGALIEAAAIGLPAVDIGARQGARERGTNAVSAAGTTEADIRAALDRALSLDRAAISHPFGDGRCAPGVAALLADPRWSDPGAVRELLRKRCAY